MSEIVQRSRQQILIDSFYPYENSDDKANEFRLSLVVMKLTLVDMPTFFKYPPELQFLSIGSVGSAFLSRKQLKDLGIGYILNAGKGIRNKHQNFEGNSGETTADADADAKAIEYFTLPLEDSGCALQSSSLDQLLEPALKFIENCRQRYLNHMKSLESTTSTSTSTSNADMAMNVDMSSTSTSIPISISTSNSTSDDSSTPSLIPATATYTYTSTSTSATPSPPSIISHNNPSTTTCNCTNSSTDISTSISTNSSTCNTKGSTSTTNTNNNTCQSTTSTDISTNSSTCNSTTSFTTSNTCHSNSSTSISCVSLKLLVHCFQGKSRSALVIIAYLIK